MRMSRIREADGSFKCIVEARDCTPEQVRTVAAMAVALAQLIRLIMIFGNSRRRD